MICMVINWAMAITQTILYIYMFLRYTILFYLPWFNGVVENPAFVIFTVEMKLVIKVVCQLTGCFFRLSFERSKVEPSTENVLQTFLTTLCLKSFVSFNIFLNKGQTSKELKNIVKLKSII
jgi:hypothetical protein